MTIKQCDRCGTQYEHKAMLEEWSKMFTPLSSTIIFLEENSKMKLIDLCDNCLKEF